MKTAFSFVLVLAIHIVFFGIATPVVTAQENSSFGGNITWVSKDQVKVEDPNLATGQTTLTRDGFSFINRFAGVSGSPTSACIQHIEIDVTEQDFNRVWSNGDPSPIPYTADYFPHVPSGCRNSQPVVLDDGEIRFANSDSAEEVLGDDIDQDALNSLNESRGDSGEEDEEEDSCESKGTWGWVLCPSVRLIDEGTKWLDNEIAKLLEINSDVDFDSNPSLQEAAANIRNVAFSILIPIMLIMIIATALGFDFVSAYTVKKALPRLVIAVIFIAISYPLLTFLVELVEIIGRGMAGFLAGPFGGINNLNLSQLMPQGLSILVEGPAILFGAVIVIWLFGIPILAAVAIAFLTLLLRQMFIVGLILIAPLAILAWIFPGNDKLWDGWRKTFTILLLMYPIIMGLIAIGRIFASLFVSDDLTDHAGIVDTIFAFFAYMLPYAFIPFVFKTASGLFGTITGALDNRSKGFFDKQRQKRAEKWAGYKSGTEAPVGLRGRAGKPFRAVGAGIGAGAKGRYGFGTRGLAAKSMNLSNAATDFTKTPEWQAQQENDLVLQAAASGATAQEAVDNMVKFGFAKDKDEAKQRVAQAQATIGLGRKQQVAAAKQLVRTGTGYSNYGQMVQTLGAASGGSEGTASELAGYANAITKQVGRHDLAPGFGTVQQDVLAEGGVRMYDEEKGWHTQSRADTHKQAVDAWQSGSLYQQGNGKPSAIKNMNAHFKDKLSTGTRDEKRDALVYFEELGAMKNSANGAVAAEINNALDDVTQAQIKSVDAMNPGILEEAKRTARSYERISPDHREQQGAGGEGEE